MVGNIDSTVKEDEVETCWSGFVLSDEEISKERSKLGHPGCHCYFCGSPYVCTMKSDGEPVRVSCLICDSKFLIDYANDDVGWANFNEE